MPESVNASTMNAITMLDPEYKGLNRILETLALQTPFAPIHFASSSQPFL